jgi:SAM-dependent methyltransferase
MDIDSPETTRLRKQIIEKKPFLRRIYEEWYAWIAAHVPAGSGEILELGSGAGFLEDYIPGLITSDVFLVPGVARVVDAHHLPFSDASLRAIVMSNVFHHLMDPVQFLHEATRCVRLGGAVVMIEPWASSWSRLIYSRLHHEPFEPQASEWSIPQTGPLSGANGALPWILFERDRIAFEQKFPEWKIREVSPFMPFRYLLSGGVSLRSFMPVCTFAFWRWLESLLNRSMSTWAMFARIVLSRATPMDPAEGRLLGS